MDIFGGQDSIYTKFKIGKTNLIRIVFGLGETWGNSEGPGVFYFLIWVLVTHRCVHL